jgi:NAD+ diphosphatase
MDHYRRSLRNNFTGGPLDRASDRRLDEEWLTACLKDETTRYLPVWQSRNLMNGRTSLKPVFLSPDQVRKHIREAESTILLGIEGDSAYFALGLPDQESASSPEGPVGLGELGQFRDLRQVAPLLDEHDGALLAFARAMVYWHRRHRFCGDCGSPTISMEAGYMRVCTNRDCEQRQFPRTDPAIIVLVTCGDRGLLGRKPSWPEGMYSTIAGFVEPGESIEDAVLREVQEETGVRVVEMCYQSSQPWPFPTSLMLGFRARAKDEAIQIDKDELEHARWFTRKEIKDGLEQGALRLPPEISISRRLIEGWFDEGDLGPLRDVRSE